MSEAPERIWVSVRGDKRGGEWQPAWPLITGFTMEVPGSTPYVRADLCSPTPPTDESAVERVARAIRGVHREFNGNEPSGFLVTDETEAIVLARVSIAAMPADAYARGMRDAAEIAKAHAEACRDGARNAARAKEWEAELQEDHSAKELDELATAILSAIPKGEG